MPNPQVTGGGRRQTELTRARILEAARQQLGRAPESSLGDIAEVAGVVRRTVYDHFAGRSALVEGLVTDAAEALRRALTGAPDPGPEAIDAMAGFVLALWPVGDRYRTLLRLAPQDLGEERVNEILGPARDTARAIITRGQQQGVFHTSVPPEPLSRALERLILALLECVNAGTWSDDGSGSATAVLIALGVDGDLAAARVRGLDRPELVCAR
ncbi:TetR/AcrR family transcriptional regulator [Streptomyces sp. NPDC051738]|uniref:TetR/AcrR family transcriptional regulator n=1 Tax=Streptomyces sp. NPDC051738 TaxID=3365672 RepID=UPI0037D6449C